MCPSRRNGARALALALLIVYSHPAVAGPAAFAAPVGKFRDASSTVIQATKTYFTELNKVERDHYIYTQAAAALPIKLSELEQAEIFSKEGIAARLDALNQLANYTELLYTLATGNATDAVRTQAANLQTSVTNLSGTIKTLTGIDDTQFKAAAASALPAVGVVLQNFSDRKAEHALREAIATGAEPINNLIDVIGRDARLAYQRKRNEFSRQRVVAVDNYNREYERRPQDIAKLKTLADQISAEEDRWEAFLSAQPDEGLLAMQEANQALIRFARIQKPTSSDYTAFAGSIDAYCDTARRIGDSMTLLKR